MRERTRERFEDVVIGPAMVIGAVLGFVLICVATVAVFALLTFVYVQLGAFGTIGMAIGIVWLGYVIATGGHGNWPGRH